jgi:hypothetical protein
MVRRLTTATVLVLTMFAAAPLAVAEPAAASTPHLSASAAPTVVSRVRPVDAHGNLLGTYRSIRSRGGARCSSGSDAVGAGAYRCIAGHTVYDPCWVSANRAYVYCLSAPWSFEVVQLHVTRGYNNVGFSSHLSKTPWGLQLSNGQQCKGVQGSTSTVSGKRIGYRCQRVKYVLVGQIDKHHRAWRIRKAVRTSGGHYKLDGWVAITNAWLGRTSLKGKL